MRCPFATWKPVTAHGDAMASHIGVVIHVTAGEGDPYNEFANPANEVSSHFGIGNGQGGMADGALEQYVDTDLASWAQVDGNATYLSVETEGQPTEYLTNAQLVTFAKVMAWAHDTYAIPLVTTDTPGQPGLILHGDGGTAWGGHFGCPGTLRASQRQAILTLARNFVTTVPPVEVAVATLSKPAVAVLPSKSGQGYAIIAADGGVFCYGDFPFHGSMGGKALAAPVVGGAVTPTGAGYWLIAADGGIFAFGDAGFHGSAA